MQMKEIIQIGLEVNEKKWVSEAYENKTGFLKKSIKWVNLQLDWLGIREEWQIINIKNE